MEPEELTLDDAFAEPETETVEEAVEETGAVEAKAETETEEKPEGKTEEDSPPESKEKEPCVQLIIIVTQKRTSIIFLQLA